MTLFTKSTSFDKELIPLAEQLKAAFTSKEKVQLLESFPKVKDYLQKTFFIQNASTTCSEEEKIILYSMIAIDQAEHVFHSAEVFQEEFRRFCSSLIPIEKFYQFIGGIVGYHVACLKLFFIGEAAEKGTYRQPKAIDISEQNELVDEAVFYGLKSLGSFAEIYPLGGAADRLSLRDEKTGEFLPAAKLEFCTPYSSCKGM